MREEGRRRGGEEERRLSNTPDLLEMLATNTPITDSVFFPPFWTFIRQLERRLH